MKRLKRLLCCFLVLLQLGMVACGPKPLPDDETSPDTAGTTETDSADSENHPPDGETEGAVDTDNTDETEPEPDIPPVVEFEDIPLSDYSSMQTQGDISMSQTDTSDLFTLADGEGRISFTMPTGCYRLSATARGSAGEVYVLRDGVRVASHTVSSDEGVSLTVDAYPGEEMVVVMTGQGTALENPILLTAANRQDAFVHVISPMTLTTCLDGVMTVRGTAFGVSKVQVTAGSCTREATVGYDGQWTAILEGIEGDSVTVTATADADGKELRYEQTLALSVQSSAVQFVHDLEWERATCHTSRAEPSRQAAFDKQSRMVLNGVTYRNGFGTHARDTGQDDADVELLIPEGSTYFEAVVGLDDRMSPDTGNGTVEFMVLLDGEIVARSGIMNPTSPSYQFYVPVSGASRIILRTTNGGDSAAYDAADWCDAKFTTLAISNPEMLDHTILINGVPVGENSYLTAGDVITTRGTFLPSILEDEIGLAYYVSAYSADDVLIGRSRAALTVPADRTNTCTLHSESLTVGTTQPARVVVTLVDTAKQTALCSYELPTEIMTNPVPAQTKLYGGENPQTVTVGTNAEYAYQFHATDTFGRVSVTLEGSGAQACVTLYAFHQSVINSTYTEPIAVVNTTVTGTQEIHLVFSDRLAGEYLLAVQCTSGSLTLPLYGKAAGGVTYCNNQHKEGEMPVSVYYYNPDAPARKPSSVSASTASTATLPAEKQRAEAMINGYLADLSTLPVSFKIGNKAYRGFGQDFTEISRTETRNGDKTSVLIGLRHTSGLEITLDIAKYYDYAAFEWTVYFANNTGKNSQQISNLCAADITFEGDDPVLNGLYGDTMNETTSEIMNNQPYTLALAEGRTQRFASRNGRPTDTGFPYYDFMYGDGGVLMAIGWQGQWKSSFTYKNGVTTFTAGQETLNTYLKDGETIRTPLMAFVFYDGRNEDRATNLWRHWYMDCNMYQPGGQEFEPAFGIITTEAANIMTSATEKKMIDLMDAYHAEGIDFDYLWMDAGWYYISTSGKQVSQIQDYAITGTWSVDTKRFPTEFKDISARAALYDAGTILWFEPERVGMPLSELKTDGTTLRREWIITSPEGWNFVNYGNPEALAWVTDRVIGILDKGDISIYREDFNIPPLSAWKAADGANRAGITENLYVQGHLQFWDAIQDQFPDMMIDTCASGGRRNDLESLRRAVPLHISDYFINDYTRRQSVHYSLFKWFPYFKAQNINHGAFTDYDFRSSLAPFINCALNITSSGVDKDKVREFRAMWDSINDYYNDDYYTLTEWNIDETKWIGWEFIDPEEGCGFMQFYRRERSEDSTRVIKLKGLDMDATYELTDVDGNCGGTYTGYELMKNGFTVVIPEAKSGAVILIVKK